MKAKRPMEHPLMIFARTILRGCGQVMFQNNAATGLIFFAGIFYNSPILGICALLGTIASTGTAMALKADQAMVRDGLFGFNGTLAGIAIPFYFPFEPALLGIVVLNGAFTTIVMAALLTFLEKWDVPPLTAPFVLSTWLFLLAAHAFHLVTPGPLMVPALPHADAAAQIGQVTFMTLWEGTAKGLGEVMFQDHGVTGILFLAGLAVNAPVSALAAFLGSLAGLITAWLLKVPEPALHLGLYGFNPVLCAIALFGVFYSPKASAGLLALAAVIMAVFTTAAMTVLLSPAGAPALTGPFILVTWFFLFAGKQLKVPGDAALKPAAVPEKII